MTENRKICFAAGCKRLLPRGRRKFCSDKCSNRIHMQKKRAAKIGKEWKQDEETLTIPSEIEAKRNVQSRRGTVYKDIVESGLAQDILDYNVLLEQ